MRLRTLSSIAIVVLLAAVSGVAFAQDGNNPVGVPNFYGVKITEVSYGPIDCVELTNFGCAALNLQNYVVQWWDDAMGGPAFCGLPAIMIQPGESIVVQDMGDPAPPEAPMGTQIILCLPNLTTACQGLEVALVDNGANPVDRVRIGSAGGAAPVNMLPGIFRNFVRRGILDPNCNFSVERIWGLDSDGPTDWTEQVHRSMGLENRSSGRRTTIDPVVIEGSWMSSPNQFQALLGNVVINEIDQFPGYIELYNKGAAAVNLVNWRFLCSSKQNQIHSIISPFPAATILPAGNYLVLGNGVAPPDLVAGTSYVDVGTAIPFTIEEFACVLYDGLGRVIDAVRTTGWDATLSVSTNACPQTVSQVPGISHNHPRAPTHWADFVGVAGRTCQSIGGSPYQQNAIGRITDATLVPIDTNRGTDWRSVYTRTLGASNANFAAGVGHGDLVYPLDVRCNSRWTGTGLALIANAGPNNAGNVCGVFFGTVPSHGFGPFFGLSSDAFFQALELGVLDGQGSLRLDFAPFGAPPLDLIYYIRNAAGTAFVTRTWAFEFNSMALMCPF